jgi:hypothetical protein
MPKKHGLLMSAGQPCWDDRTLASSPFREIAISWTHYRRSCKLFISACPFGTLIQPDRGVSGRTSVKKIDRRSALKIGFAAASAAVVKPAAAQPTDALAGKDTSPSPGVVVRTYGENPSMIPGFKTVSMRDIIVQPGSKTPGGPMPNPMVCHMLEGEMRIDQDGKTFTAKKNFCWTCNKDTKEQGFNDGSVVAIMRITDLKV